jgi:hypothetical protein
MHQQPSLNPQPKLFFKGQAFRPFKKMDEANKLIPLNPLERSQQQQKQENPTNAIPKNHNRKNVRSHLKLIFMNMIIKLFYSDCYKFFESWRESFCKTKNFWFDLIWFDLVNLDFELFDIWYHWHIFAS